MHVRSHDPDSLCDLQPSETTTRKMPTMGLNPVWFRLSGHNSSVANLERLNNYPSISSRVEKKSPSKRKFILLRLFRIGCSYLYNNAATTQQFIYSLWVIITITAFFICPWLIRSTKRFIYALQKSRYECSILHQFFAQRIGNLGRARPLRLLIRSQRQLRFNLFLIHIMFTS